MTSETAAEFVERVEANAIIAGADLSRLFALARRGAAVQWRPIEEAPKDGTRFIGVYANRTRIYWWSDKQAQRFANGWAFNGNGLENPTHWMPLPPPPAGETNEPV